MHKEKKYWEIPFRKYCLVLEKVGSPRAESTVLTIFETLKDIDFQGGGNSHY